MEESRAKESLRLIPAFGAFRHDDTVRCSREILRGVMSNDLETPKSAGEFDFQSLTFLTAALGIVGSFTLCILFAWSAWPDPGWRDLSIAHARAVIGIPCAVLLSTIVVSLFRTTEGPVKFEIWIFKFEGASGPIVMWALCFLVIIWGLYALW